jgi:hypothetical protein
MGRALWLLWLMAAPALAWGPNGHRIVARIAENHLSEEARRAVTVILGPETLAHVAVWADDIRSEPAWSKAAPWHYISIDDKETLETTARAPEGDVLSAMQQMEATLRDAKADPRARSEALRFLVHFVGDVHQPLHVGRRADRGGNGTAVSWFGQRTNLHAVWDNSLIESEKLSFSEFAEFLDHARLREIREWQAASYADWIRESKALREQVYAIGKGDLGFEYAYKNLPVVKRRLLEAGIRLAGKLNEIFADAP